MKQADVNNLFSEFQIEREDAIYPPYHGGQYLEEYFVSKYLADKPNKKSLFIPVHWTAVFNYRVNSGLGLKEGGENFKLRQRLFEKLKSLPEDLEYFTVSTHDDAPQGTFPKHTRHFYAGGNSSLGTDPIPLICSPLPQTPDFQKMVFCSFVGSATNPIRNTALQAFSNKGGYIIKAFHWQPDVSADQQNLFMDLTSRSRFTLCPRGYGATSYRLYEAMQLGSIPIYISDKHLLPWSDELDWTDFCIVSAPSTQYDDLDNFIKSLTETHVRKMQEKIKSIYDLYFTIPAVYNQILRRLK